MFSGLATQTADASEIKIRGTETQKGKQKRLTIDKAGQGK